MKDVQRSMLPPSSGLKTWIQVDTLMKTCEDKQSQILEDKLPGQREKLFQLTTFFLHLYLKFWSPKFM
jgi:hypothetical protein